VSAQGSIICGVDGSPDSLHALRTAAILARRLETRLVAAHVADPPGATFAYAGMGVAASMGRARALITDPEVGREAARAILTRNVAEAGAELAELRVLAGDPAESLADLADEEGATLIVVGSRGRGAFKAAFLGSVSNSLIGIARCPVLVVPPGVVEAAADR
jgi:nucleotide-binding universal stress UspA family protein